MARPAFLFLGAPAKPADCAKQKFSALRPTREEFILAQPASLLEVQMIQKIGIGLRQARTKMIPTLVVVHSTTP